MSQVIKYEVIGREDGRWVIQAFNRNNESISARIICSSVRDTMRIWLMLNGYLTPSKMDGPTELEDQTKKAS